MPVINRILTALILLVIISKGYPAFCSGGGGSAEDSCSRNYFTLIQKEFNLGHYSMVDSIYSEYTKSYCYSNKRFLTIKILKIMKEQRLADSYRKKEADEMDAKIDSIIGILNSYFPFRVGTCASFNLSNIGSVGWSIGTTFGYHARRLSGLSLGIDWFVGYQRVPLVFDLTKNKDKDNKYDPGGFILKAKGYSSFYVFSMVGTLNKEPFYNGYDYYLERAVNRRWGWGILVGVEYSELRHSHLHNFYYEYDYVDSAYYQSTYVQNNVVKFKSYLNSNYDSDTLFTTKHTINILFGFNIYMQPYKHLLFNLSPYTSIGLNKFSLSNIKYDKKISFIEFKFTCSYLFNAKKGKQKFNESISY